LLLCCCFHSQCHVWGTQGSLQTTEPHYQCRICSMMPIRPILHTIQAACLLLTTQ
jgi:hypothetical protein